MLNPTKADYCYFASEKPSLVVVCDTEEEFDWSLGFSQEPTSVKSIASISKVQQIFDEFNITPVYVVSYPIATQPEAYRPLLEIKESSRCVIGAHLHPTVTPPIREPINARNNFPCNLDPESEFLKLKTLSERIETTFRVRPTIYKAALYGVGKSTPGILSKLGFEVDLSVCPSVDYSRLGGPDFTNFVSYPYWFGDEHRLLELPLTACYHGPLRLIGRQLIYFTKRTKYLHLYGILSRIGMIDRAWLTPERFSAPQLKKIVRDLMKDGLRVFSLAFHSPSLHPGMTPHVRTSKDLERLLNRFRIFFEFFLGELGGRTTTPLELKNKLSEVSANEE